MLYGAMIAGFYILPITRRYRTHV